MHIRFTKNQCRLIQWGLLPSLCAAVATLYGVTAADFVVVLICAAFLYLGHRVLRELRQPDEPKGQVYWINQSVSVELPEGWSIEFDTGLLTLRHHHTTAALRVRTKHLSPAQIRDRIIHKLDQFYHD